MTDKMREDAIREAARNHAMDEYFNARKHLAVSAYETTLFEAGFDRAWQAARTVPEGYVMVPVEPTQEMLKAGERGIGVSSYVRKGMTIREYRFFKSGWDAMLAAAPEGKK